MTYITGSPATLESGSLLFMVSASTLRAPMAPHEKLYVDKNYMGMSETVNCLTNHTSILQPQVENGTTKSLTVDSSIISLYIYHLVSIRK